MTESVAFWRRAAISAGALIIALIVAGVVYVTVWPVILEGRLAYGYLRACAAAKICPTDDTINERLKAMREAPQPPNAAATPTKPSAPADPPKR